MPKDKGFSSVLVRFVVKKVLAVLVNYGSEEKLCQDAIDCLLSLVESHASDIASSAELFEYLNSLDIARLPNRSNLMKALVLIGAAANDQELQENMFKMVSRGLQKFSKLSFPDPRPSVREIRGSMFSAISVGNRLTNCRLSSVFRWSGESQSESFGSGSFQ